MATSGQHLETGRHGEAQAVQFLRVQGFQILFRNWRFHHLEIDIIASQGQVLHFIEVKTRSRADFGRAEKAVDRRKLERVKRAASAYLQAHPQWEQVSFDVIGIERITNGEPDIFFWQDVF